MSGNITKKYFIGKSSRTDEWASVYTYKPHSSEMKALRGEVFATISLKGPKDFSTSTAGNFLLDYFHESYFESDKENALEALNDSVHKTGKHLQKLIQNDKEANVGIDLDLLSIALVGDICYVVNMGVGHLYVFRDGNLTDLSSHLLDSTGEGVMKLGSFEMKSSDVYLLGTPTIDEQLEPDQLIDAAMEFSETQLKQVEFEDESRLALIMVGYNLNREESHNEFELHKNIKEELVKNLEKVSAGEGLDPNNEVDVELSGKASIKTDNFDKLDPLDEGFEIVDTFEEEPLAEEKTLTQRTRESYSEEDGLEDFEEELKEPVIDVLKGKLFGFIDKVKERQRKEEYTQPKESREEMLAKKEEKLTIDSEDEKTYKVILAKIKAFGGRIGKVLKDTVWGEWFGMSRNDMYVRGSTQYRKRNMRFIGVVIIVVLGVLYFSITGILSSLDAKEKYREAEIHLKSAKTLVDDVDEIAPVKAKAESSDLGKQELFTKLTEAEDELSKIGDIEDLKKDAEELKIKISELRDLLNRTIALLNPTELIDFASSFPGSNTVDIDINNGEIFVADKEYGKIYRVSYTGGSPSELTSDLDQPRSISIDDNGDIIVLDANEDMGLSTVSIADGVVKRHAGTSTFRVGNITQIEFTDILGGRVYGIDQSLKQVVYLSRAGDGYGIPQSRFSLDELSSGVDLSINDLKIYTLADINQGLYRFYNEVDDTPSLNGLESGENLYDASALFVDGVYVIIADPGNQRVLVFEKVNPNTTTEINLIGQYVYRGDGDVFKNIKEIVADRANNKLFVLDGSKVYQLDLKELNQF